MTCTAHTHRHTHTYHMHAHMHTLHVYTHTLPCTHMHTHVYTTYTYMRMHSTHTCTYIPIDTLTPCTTLPPHLYTTRMYHTCAHTYAHTHVHTTHVHMMGAAVTGTCEVRKLRLREGRQAVQGPETECGNLVKPQSVLALPGHHGHRQGFTGPGLG